VDKELILAVVAAVSRVLDIACAKVFFGVKDINGEAVLRCHPDRIRPLAMREAWRNSDSGACPVTELLVCDNAEIRRINATGITRYESSKGTDFMSEELFAFDSRGFIYTPVGKGQRCGHDAIKITASVCGARIIGPLGLMS
jgi:hypothetical protein